MNKNNITVATITWARDEQEESLLRASLQVLAELEIPVFVCDGGSGNNFLDFLRSFPHFTIVERKAKGLWGQAQSSLLAASHTASRFILYTEPDKKDFFRNSLPGFIAAAKDDDQLGILLASRSATAFATFPAFQRSTETTINNCCGELIGRPFEYTYGPFLLTRQVVPYLENVANDIGWGWRPYAFNIAHRLGYKVESFEGDFNCPETQREDSMAERMYRMRQLTQNIEGLLLSANAIINPAR